MEHISKAIEKAVEKYLESGEPFFLNSKMKQTILPERIDAKNGRWYRNGDDFKPSVTTFLNIIGKDVGFMKWLGDSRSFKDAMDYAEKRADIGSRFHTNAYKLVTEGEVITAGLEDEEIKRIYAFIQFWKQHEITPIAMEYPLWHEDLPFAGTVDLLAWMPDKKDPEKKNVVLFDWKTGSEWGSYKYQLSAYKYLCQAVFGVEVKELACVYFGGRYRNPPDPEGKPVYKIKKIKPIPFVRESPTEVDIMSVYDLWILENKNPKPKLVAEYPEVIKLEEEEDGSNS